jgi:hypothetical protein
MTKKELREYRAKVTNDAGIFRSKVPSPLVRELGARPGDYMVFHYDGASKAVMSVSRSKGVGKASAKSRKTQTSKTAKRR